MSKSIPKRRPKNYKPRPVTYLRYLREKAGYSELNLVARLGIDRDIYIKYEQLKTKMFTERAIYIYQFYIENHPDIVPDWLSPHILQEEIDL